MFTAGVDYIFQFFFSERSRKRFEHVAFGFAIIAFIVHFLAIILANAGILPPVLAGTDSYQNPIVAIYTPFSVILIYEIYLLIYYLPKSISIYIGKQYEVITLILIRKIFDDLSAFTFTNGMYDETRLKELIISFAGLIIMLLLIFCFYKLSDYQHERTLNNDYSPERERFINIKRIMAVFLVLLLIFLIINSLLDMRHIPFSIKGIIGSLKAVNITFYFAFFTALILLEVLLLLFTYNLSDKFDKAIRNIGFIISTILLKLSFRVEGYQSIVLILIAAAFGVAIMGIYRLYDKKLQ